MLTSEYVSVIVRVPKNLQNRLIVCTGYWVELAAYGRLLKQTFRKSDMATQITGAKTNTACRYIPSGYLRWQSYHPCSNYP
jgi:hypothetical protein